MTDKFCGSSLDFDSQEGSHHTITAMAFDNENHKLTVNARDMVANTTHKTEMDIPPCTYDITGALLDAAHVATTARYEVLAAGDQRQKTG